MVRRILGCVFFIFMVLAFLQCARRGNPSGGPKDITPPKLVKADPENMTVNFKANTIRLYFDEYIKLADVQNQLIVSPPLKYAPQIKPQGSANKYVEIIFKDTLKKNTTYTLNFGQSIVDNNEGNPNSFLSYVFSTGTYIDSLTVSGVVRDAFNKDADTFISVMLYEIDSSFTDSTIYKKPPNYITNTLDSTTIFRLKNLKAGNYSIVAIKDAGKNNLFDQNTDKIGFYNDTISVPTDSIFLLTLFNEIPDYSVAVPNFVTENRIIFGYQGEPNIAIEPLTILPDSVRTIITKERETDTLNYWFTAFEIDSIIFKVTNEKLNVIDTFTVKTRKVGLDSLVLTPNKRSSLNFEDPFYISANTPISSIDTSNIRIIRRDSTKVKFNADLDSVNNKIDIKFDLEPNEQYGVALLPGAIVDFFDATNDTLVYRLSTKSYADYGNLRLTVAGNARYPLILQLTKESGEMVREIYAEKPIKFEFNNLEPSKYLVRAIFDTNGNGKWDTGNYLKKAQPEQVTYYPQLIEVRANWELEQSFIISD